MKNLKNYYFLLLMAIATGFLFSCGGAKESGEDNGEVVADTVEGEAVSDTSKTIESPRKQAEGEIGGVKVVVDYGSPAVKNREIWGGLEKYGAVWRAGANETTSFEFSENIKVGDNEVPAGKYGFYLIPNENNEWVAIVNTDWNKEKHGAWGAYNYNEKHDVARVSITPEWKDEVTERLTYSVVDNGVVLEWEKMKLTIPLEAAQQN
ncbi:DUF2911 domain-containing protein [Fulvivirga sediminis]|uniref:DUF2911 domain-containing protein n=1 Tax=Fulvivirga sediminis TaxID=2803949 RepID=A0A937FBA4_9BACT|nr:DUF2911 domain-containing protein [Fulvivirga sediminis]MBL3658019.1 DUF2911 domain-containing protein [Fulvivirga sediminis]